MSLLFLLLLILPGRAAERACASNICFNGGTCKVDDETRSFKCYCNPGFSGKLCQEVCSKKCFNGICVKGSHGQEECRCKPGWTGSLCESSGSSVEGCLRTEDCPNNQTCVENDRGLRICIGDPCQTKPCRNDATCSADGEDFRCECPQGYAGKRCDADVNECELDPCRNGGTCINLDGSFECLCNGRFFGKLCADTHCNPSPCQNNGSCVDLADGFKCICPTGLTGKTCENYEDGIFNMTETPDPCKENACQNGGTCVSNGTSIDCHCRPEFTGEHCEIVSECTVGGQKCLNGGRCVRGIGGSFCQCPTDYGGILCETLEVSTGQSPCDQKPCANGGTCVVEKGVPSCRCPLGFVGPLCATPAVVSPCQPNPCKNNGHCEPVGDPSEAGFFCHCEEGFGGNFCEQPESEWISSVSELHATRQSSVAMTTTVSHQTTNQQQNVYSCENCAHSSKCVENVEGAICICEKGFSGPLCDQEGDPCASVSCPSSQVCRQKVSGGIVDTFCGCSIGRQGENCNRDTTVSFGENSLFVYQSPSVMIGSSSGPLPYSLSFSFRTTVPDVHLVSSENIFGQRLFSVVLIGGRLSVNISGTVYDRLLSVSINDGDWYTLSLQKTVKDLLITLFDGDGFEYVSRSLPRPSSFDVFSTRIGKTADEQFFVGCLADVQIEKSFVDLANSNRAVAVTAGCFRTPQCAANRCHNGGSCVDLWTHSECECKAPFLPPLCMYSLPPSTFGHRNLSSLAEISVPQDTSDHLRFFTNLQFLLRTNKKSGSVMFLGEKSSEDGATFMSVEIVNESLIVRTKLGTKTVHELRGRTPLDDNEDHEIRVERTKRHVKLLVDGVLESEDDIPSRFDHPLFVERILLGSSEGTPADAFSTKEYFKGSLQDVRINGNSAILHRTELNVNGVGRVTRLENVLEGTVSDDVCSSRNPCSKGSCRNTFNDYECTCNLGYYGRNCDQKDFCITSPCPSGGACMNVGGGFLCTTSVTMVRSSFLGFRLQSQESVEIPFVEFSIRTHSNEGKILTLSTTTSKLAISLSYGQLMITTDTPFTIRKTIADGTWKRIRLQGNILKINNASYGLPPSLTIPSNSASASLTIGQMAGIASFEGCLQDVQIGKLPKLSFYREEDLQIPEGLSYWKGLTRRKVAVGCLSSPQCESASPCLNNAVCVDLWNKVTCECASGFTGNRCETNINECIGVDCGNGFCVDGINDYRCECDPGFTGISCDVSQDLCAELPCRNNGLCENSNGSFVCECKEEWTGKTCSIKSPASCSDNPCQNNGVCTMDRTGLRCRCPPGFVGKFCEEIVNSCVNRPCQHGSCRSTENGAHKCICEEGFSGAGCDVLLDECHRDTCGGKGSCSPVWNGTLCNCAKGWRGRFCSEDVDECLDIPCENDGVCLNQAGGFQCKCRKYYLGDRCEVEGSCLKAPCVHGECVQLKHDEHTCSCHKGFEGLLCENKIDYCKKSPCVNGATCESLLGEYVCHCIPGFNGTNCEHDIDECSFGYCSNGSMCRDRVADYDCICEGTGYQGKNCTEDIDECSIPNSCLHGKCTNTIGGYKCDCEAGFIGRRCSVLDPCVPDQLNRTTHSCVHGTCINPGVKMEHGHETAIHDCKCDRGFSGPQCSTKVEERRLVALSYILGPVAAVLVVLCLLGCCLFFFVLKGKRAMHGHYSPSHQEMTGARMQMNHMIKLPPEERLI